MREIVTGSKMPPRVRAIVVQAAARHLVDLKLILSESQRRVAVEARRSACAALRDEGFALSQIAYWLNRHHSSVQHLLGEQRDRHAVTVLDHYDPSKADESGVWAI